MTVKEKKAQPARPVSKPFVHGSPVDENTVKNALKYFSMLLIVLFVTFIACASAGAAGSAIGTVVNVLLIAMGPVIFFYNGSTHGADAVAKGEIIYQKKEKGQDVTASELKVCYHPMKGFVTGLAGTLPILIPALILAFCAVVQTTGTGTLPSWMQAYLRRSDIGDALVNYTQPEGFVFVDYVRIIVRICIMPWINLAGSGNNEVMLLIERLSPVIVLIPALFYGFGYLSGKKVRTQIHTAISENNRKRKRLEQKKRRQNRRTGHSREPEKLN